jgi:putative aldouronate transport system substrate-binding protein
MKRLSVALLILLVCLSAVMAAGRVESPPVKTDGPVEFSLFIRAVPDFIPENNPWVKQIDEATNSKINWIVAAPATAWEKRNVLLASGDYPDVIMLTDPADSMYKQMLAAGKIVALDEYLAKAPNLMAHTHQVAWDAVREKDGKIYMVPRCTIIREDFWVNRLDWRQAVGMDVPVTPADWIAYARAIATMDPNKSGVRDTFAVTDNNGLMTATSTSNIKSFANAWHAGVNWYDDGNGNVFMGMFHQDGRFKQVLEFYRELYRVGGLEPDFVSNVGATIKHDKWKQGVAATNNTFVGSVDGDLQQLRRIHPNANIEFIPYPVVALSPQVSKEKQILTQTGIYNTWAITDKGKDKAEHIVKVFDYLLSDEGWMLMQHGVRGVHYDVVNGAIKRLEPAAEDFFRWQGWAMMFRRPLDKDFWLKQIIPEVYPLQEQWFEKSVNFIKTEYIQQGLAGFASQAEIAFKRSDVWTTRVNQVAMQIIVGQQPLSAWDGLLREVYAAGWQKVVDEYQAFYNANK